MERRSLLHGVHMLIVDRIISGLLILGAVLHSIGTFRGYPAGSEIWVWSLAGSLAAATIGAVNLLRTRRLGDRALAWLAGLSALLWAVLALMFGWSIGDLLDPRVLWHTTAAAGLAVLSIRQAMA